MRFKWRRKRDTDFRSFRSALTWISTHVGLGTVVEFGPGYSTWILLKHSKAKIVSYETHPKWYRRYRNVFDPERVSVLYREPGWDLREIRERVNGASLVFVDGGDRVAILREAVNLIGDDGIVFLHDAHREAYEPGIRAYPHAFFVDSHSCLLFKNRSFYEKVTAAFPDEISCRCAHCRSESRRAYIEKFRTQG
jgi:predicted O-methyltransferase YrrM